MNSMGTPVIKEGLGRGLPRLLGTVTDVYLLRVTASTRQFTALTPRDRNNLTRQVFLLSFYR